MLAMIVVNVCSCGAAISIIWIAPRPSVRFSTVGTTGTITYYQRCPGMPDLPLPIAGLQNFSAWNEDNKTICDRIASGRYYKDGPLALEPFHWSVSAPAVTVWREL